MTQQLPSVFIYNEWADLLEPLNDSRSEHHACYPQRYVNGAPTVTLPPTVVYINPDLAMDASQLLNIPGSLRCIPTPVDTVLRKVVT